MDHNYIFIASLFPSHMYFSQVEVVKHECLDECPMGPNCGVDKGVDSIYVQTMYEGTYESMIMILSPCMLSHPMHDSQ